MRMFLVGMCDIFLILYLTTLSQISPFRTSAITVDDYNELKVLEIQSREELENAKEREALSLKQIAESLKIIKAKKRELKKLESEKILASQLAKSVQEDAATVSKRMQQLEQESLSALLAKEEARRKAAEAQLRAQTANIEALKSKEKEKLAVKQAEELALQATEAKRNEENALKLVLEAKEKVEEALKRAEEARLSADNARASERDAIQQAKKAEKEKTIALRNQEEAIKAQNVALRVAETAKKEVVEVKSKIEAITQTADTAFNENINDKLTQFVVTIQAKNRWKNIVRKELVLQGVPVKIKDEYVIFTPLSHIGFGSLFEPEQFVTYDITVNSIPITKIYVKGDNYNIAALVINQIDNHSVPAENSGRFSSYMPILISLRNQKTLGVIDRLRGVNVDFFIFKRDYLRLIKGDEFFYENAGFRGTGDYAEYIVEGDQVVDLEGNFIGLAYKKNSVICIDNVDGWQEVFPGRFMANKLAEYIGNLN